MRSHAMRHPAKVAPPPHPRPHDWWMDHHVLCAYCVCILGGGGGGGGGRVWSHVRIKLAVAVSWHSLILSMQNSIAKKHGLIHVCKRKDISIEHSQAKI